ncbi:transcription factor ILI4-like [Wolffia australiana]
MSSSWNGRARANDDDVRELVSKLQALLPEARRRSLAKASPAKLLKETCSYIRSLQREVGDLSDKLSDLISDMDGENGQAEIIRALLRQRDR